MPVVHTPRINPIFARNRRSEIWSTTKKPFCAKELRTSPQLFGIAGRLPRQIRAGMQWFDPAVETVGKVASTIADTSLTLIAILVALPGFLLAFLLPRKSGPPVQPGT